MKNSPLHDKHLALNAKMADFGGWLMPIEYPGAGVLAEHSAVRESVGIFDVSHLGKASVRGVGALEFLNATFTNDLGRITDGMAQYTMLCTPQGGVVDDLIVYRNSAQDLFLVPNASNTSAVVDVLVKSAPAGIVVENLHESFAVIAVQGPKSSDVLAALGIKSDIDYMSFSHVTIGKKDVILCRTGYTGEFGYELLPSWNDASDVWDALVEIITPMGGQVCGLGARDTLRTEMGYPLHGHELSLEISPIEGGAPWAVGWKKPSFIGSEILRGQKDEGAPRVMHALVSLDRGIPRARMSVKSQSGEVLGEITSGTFSPSLKKGIALALLSPSVSIGDHVIIDVRGRDSIAEVTKAPLVPSHVR